MASVKQKLEDIQLKSEKTLSDEECDLDVEYQVSRARTEMQLKIDSLQISYDALEEKHQLLMDIKNNEMLLFMDFANGGSLESMLPDVNGNAGKMVSDVFLQLINHLISLAYFFKSSSCFFVFLMTILNYSNMVSLHFL